MPSKNSRKVRLRISAAAAHKLRGFLHSEVGRVVAEQVVPAIEQHNPDRLARIMEDLRGVSSNLYQALGCALPPNLHREVETTWTLAKRLRGKWGDQEEQLLVETRMPEPIAKRLHALKPWRRELSVNLILSCAYYGIDLDLLVSGYPQMDARGHTLNDAMCDVNEAHVVAEAAALKKGLPFDFEAPRPIDAMNVRAVRDMVQFFQHRRITPIEPEVP